MEALRKTSATIDQRAATGALIGIASEMSAQVAHHMKVNRCHPLALDDPRFRLVDGKTRPEFMLVGGAKCGSTSFARYLAAHPQVKFPGPADWRPAIRKEPNYWSWRRYHAIYQNLFVNYFQIHISLEEI